MSDEWRISAEDAEEYTRSLGQIMSGGWRQVALAQRLGVPAALGMTTDAWVRERIGGYVRLGLDERREAARELTDPDGEYQLSQRQAAEVLGISQKTVSRDVQDESHDSRDMCVLGEADDDPESYDSLGTVFEPADAAPSEPTAGDVIDEIADVLDESGAAEQVAAERRVHAMRIARLSWVRFVAENPPGVFAEGVAANELPDVLRHLDRVIGWLQQAREVTARARRPRGMTREA